jgi:hypothetical protein
VVKKNNLIYKYIYMPITLNRTAPKPASQPPYMSSSYSSGPTPGPTPPPYMSLSYPPGPTPIMRQPTPASPPPGTANPLYMSLSYPPGPTPAAALFNNGASISTEVFRFKCLVQVYHWQTTSFSRHKGADVLLDSLNGFLSNVVMLTLKSMQKRI